MNLSIVLICFLGAILGLGVFTGFIRTLGSSFQDKPAVSSSQATRTKAQQRQISDDARTKQRQAMEDMQQKIRDARKD